MVFNTLSVGTAVTPTVIETYFSHYLNRKPLRQKPTAHISYHEGLQLIRRFLHYASFHTVEDIQAFTSQWVPVPPWVSVEDVTLPQRSIDKAAEALIVQLGHKGSDRVGGTKWWQWRRDGSSLKASWIEMEADRENRRRTKEDCKRIMLYVHGGAYFFGSVDEHRYQIQRHARKLGARVLAPRYRLAPQFPFPCGLHDCLAAYLYLLTIQDPSTIVLAGDSAGAGMILSILVILRDQGILLPAGAILISPWVDLTHSFPSVAGDASHDYIPAHGFLQRPSAAWPPPNNDDMEDIALHAVEKVVGDNMPRKSSQHERQVARDEAVQGFSVDHQPGHLSPQNNDANPAGTEGAGSRPGDTIPGPGHDLSIMLDGKLITIKDQIQMYTTNQLISHPLVSPILQPSLGGLPPLLILTGGGEVLRDEQIYLAHKAADPSKYPPGEAYMAEHSDEVLAKWKPTDVQLQVWDDLCHVAPTLSFTRPAKFMFRSIAQFGAWALAKAQRTDIDIMDDDDVSVISSDSGSGSDTSSESKKPRQEKPIMKNGALQGQAVKTKQVGKAGEPLPPFKNHMIRQRVDRHGRIFPLGPPSALPALQVPANEIGVIKPGPVRKWMAAKKDWDNRFAREKRKVQKQRAAEMAKGYEGFGDDEVPPPSALAGRRGLSMEKEPKQRRSWGLSLWSLWGSSHDEKTIKREQEADREPETTTATPQKDGAAVAASGRPKMSQAHSRSRSRRRNVSYTGQSEADAGEKDHRVNASGEDPSLLSPMSKSRTNATTPSQGAASPPAIEDPSNSPLENIAGTATRNRPTAEGKAFPFKLGAPVNEHGRNASTTTLTSQMGVGLPTPMPEDGKEKRLGYTAENTLLNGDPVRHTADGKRPEMERWQTAQETI
ncbi:MAG: hypothetical protein Q9220_000440 [cf. Caloplaca sp. 1 TL-2023]